jgi:hypothetical protein
MTVRAIPTAIHILQAIAIWNTAAKIVWAVVASPTAMCAEVKLFDLKCSIVDHEFMHQAVEVVIDELTCPNNVRVLVEIRQIVENDIGHSAAHRHPV